MRLQAKLALAMGVATALAVVLTATILFAVAAGEQRDSTDRFLRERIEAIDSPNGRLPNRASRPGGGDDFDRDTNLLVRITFSDGDVLIDDGLPDVGSAGSDRVAYRTIDLEGRTFRMATVDFERRGREGTLQIATNIERDERSIERLRNRVLLFGGLGIGLAALIGALWARRLSRPIVEVASAAQQMSQRNDLPTRIRVDRSDEVGDLARSFNDMLAALEISREQQQRLVADASHELRTPLTSLRLKVDLLNSTSDIAPSTRAELIDGASVELERLTGLVNELVELAADPTSGDEAPEELDLFALASDTVERVRRTSGRTIELVGSASIVLGRERMLRRAISNLIDNAIKYAPAEQPIEVTVEDGTITVRDHGPGIAPDDLDHVFDRFFRANEARLQPGNGIGLAIVSRVAQLHAGETFARNAPGGGAVVGFSIPPGGGVTT